MKITRIKLKDWGRHKLLEKTVDAQVVGLLGPNGCGKTTVLKAVEYALTGILPDKAETYVRGMGDGDANNGSVTLWFEKDGREGVIFRQVGASPKRKLEWDGLTLTKAKEVEEALEEIFGADRQAVSNAVFVSQGELDRMLFGTQAEREALWMKLMLLNYMDARHDLVDRKIAVLSGSLQDFTMHVDELNAQITESEAEASAKEAAMSAQPDQTAALEALSAYSVSRAHCESLGRDLAVLKSQERESKATLNASVTDIHNFMVQNCDVDLLDQPSITQLCEVRDSMSKMLVQSEKELREVEDRLRRKHELNQMCADLRDKEQKVLYTKAALAELTPVLGDEQTLVDLNNTKRIIDDLDDLKANVAELKTAMSASGDKVSTLVKQGLPWSAEDLTRAQAEFTLVEERLGVLKLQTSLRSALQNHGNQQCCPVCDRSMAGVDPCSKLPAMLDSLAAVQAEYNALKARITQMQSENADWNARMSRQQEVIADLIQRMTIGEAEVARLTAAVGDRTKATIDADIKKITCYREERSRYSNDLFSAESMVSYLTDKIGKIQREPDYKQLLLVEDEDVGKARAARDKLQNTADSINNRLLTLENLRIKTEALVKQAEAKSRDLDQATSNLERQTDVLNMLQLGDLIDADALEINYKLESLKEACNTYRELKGAALQAKLQVRTLRDKRRALDDRIAADARVRALIEQLRQLKETLHRGGLPMTFMQHMFEEITEIAKDHLSDMQANFDVVVDPARPLTLSFTRTDDDNGITMPQDKLSGGQKVRLSIAMLMAVQTRLLSDVGLLVLDEPSVHLDTEGVENTRDLLMDMGRRIGTSDMQVLVCDHHEGLSTAFGSVIRID